MSLNPKQVKIYNKLLKFIKKPQEDPQFLINGEAGAGKTFTIIYSLSKMAIPENKLNKYNFFFLAPTNAAKKVLNKTFLNFVSTTFPDKINYITNHVESKGGQFGGVKTIYFKTMHSFFKSQREFDGNGNVLFEINPDKSVLADVVDKQRELLGEKAKYNIKNVVVLDESSMIGPDKYELFKKFIEVNKKNNIRVVYIGDKNQLTYIEDKEEEETDEEKLNKKSKKDDYFSPVFSHIENKTLLTGNERTNNENITKVINRLKKCVINNSFNFKLKKSDMCDNIKLIVDTDIGKSPLRELVKKDCPKFITFSNKRRIYLNDMIRRIIYGADHPRLKEYLFLDGERIIFENSYITEFNTYHNMDEHIVKNVKFDILESINFFGVFTKTYAVQKLLLDNSDVLFKMCKSQIDEFKTITKIFKLCVGDFTGSEETRVDKCFNMLHQCPACNCTKSRCRFFDKKHMICEDCYKLFMKHITDKHICKFCNSLNDHDKCPEVPKPLSFNAIRKIKTDLYEVIQQYIDMYDPPITYSYAITTYKSQGSTYDVVVVDYDDIYRCTVRDRRSLTRSMYVSASRVRDTLYFLNYFQK